MSSRGHRLLGGLALGLLLSVGGPGIGSANAADVAFTITDPRVGPTYCLTTDVTGQYYWTANAGDGAAYALTPAGKVAGRITVGGVTDVQAMAWAGTRLFIADIGDVTERRSSVKVLSVDTPKPGQLVSVRTWTFVYADRAHDAGTLLISQTGQVYVVTNEDAAGVYAAPPAPSTGGVKNKLTRVADAPSGITDGTYLGDGRVVLRSATTLYLLDGATFEVLAQSPIAGQPEGAAVTVTLDGSALLLASSVKGTPVLTQAVPAPASPTPEPEPVPAPASSASPGTVVSGGGDQTGTVLAILGAGALALLAAVIVFFKN